MATNVGTLEAKLFLDYKQFHSGMQTAVTDAKGLGSALQNAFGGFKPSESTVLKQANQLSKKLTDIFSKTQAQINLTMNASQFETTAHEVNEWVSSVKDRLATGLSDVTPHVNIQPAQAELDNFKKMISETRAFADQQLHDIRPSIHIGNANRSLNNLKQNLDSFRAATTQPINVVVSMDSKAINMSMQQLTERAQQIGSELSSALNTVSSAGFQNTETAIHNMAQAMLDVINRASAFEATLQNMNQTLQQVSAVRTYTSQLAEDFNTIATAAENAANSVNNVGDQLYELLGVIEGLTSGHAYMFDDMAKQIQTVANSASNLNTNLGKAQSRMQQLTPSANSAASGTKRIAKEAEKVQAHLQSSVNWAARLRMIIGGIVISQSFYQITGLIRGWVGMANEFAMEMEQAAISFKYLMGSADEAGAFIEALQDFAVQSPLDTAGAEKAARLLMTMGISAKNTIPVLRVLTDTATVAGGEIEDTVYRISLALGQMLQSGTVKMQEIRQLVNANVPIYTILEEELGMTAKQVSQIGKEGVNSAKAVNAILRGLQKRFSGAGLEMQKTVKGAVNAIKDSFSVLYNIMISGPYEWVRSKLVAISEVMVALANVARRLGPGGIFEAIFTPEQQAVLRNVIGAFMQLGYAIKYVAIVAGTIFGDTLKMIVHVLNIILPPISILINCLAQLAVYFYKSSPLVRTFVAALMTVFVATRIVLPLIRILWTLMGGAAVFRFAATMVGYFTKALAFMITPIGAAITAIIALIAIIGYVTGAFGALIGKIKSVISWWTTLNKTLNSKLKLGYNPNDILKPWKDKTASNNADDYLGQLQNISDTMGDIGDEADKTKKKLKNSFLQSFDEVYQIKEKQDTGQTAADLGLDDYDFPIEIFDDIPDDLLGDIGKIKDALGGLDLPGADWWDAWGDVFKNWPDWLPAALGAALGAIIGALLGGPAGAIIGAALGALCGWLWGKLADLLKIQDKNWAMAASALLAALAALVTYALTGSALWAALAAVLAFFAGLFWEKIAETFGLTEAEKKKALISTAICSSLGAIIGYALGGPIGAIVGGLLGTFVGEFWSILCDKFKLSDVMRYGAPIALAVGALLGKALAGGTLGTALGAVGGLTAIRLIDAIVQGIQTGDWSGIGDCLGAALGTAIGGLIGGRLGATVGGAIGNLVDGIMALLQERFGFSDFTLVTTKIGMGLGTAIGYIAGGPAGAVIGAAIGTLCGWIVGKFKEVLDGEAPWQELATPIGTGLGAAIGFLLGGPVGALIGAAIGDLVGLIVQLIADNWDPITQYFSQLGQDIAKFFNEDIPQAWNSFVAWCSSIPGAISSFFSGIGSTLSSFFTEIDTAWNTLCTQTIPYYLGFAVGAIAGFFVDIGTAFEEFFTVTIPAAWNDFCTDWNNFWNVTIPAVIDDINQFFTDCEQAFIDFFTVTIPAAWNTFVNDWNNFWNVTFPAVMASIGQFFINCGQAFINFFTVTIPQAWTSFTTAWNTFWQVTLPAALSSIGQFFSDLYNDFVTWGANIVQGFINGITTAWNTLIANISVWVNSFLQGFRDGFGIHSPSTVMAELGGFIVDGLLNGITTAWNLLVTAIGGFITTLFTAFTTGFNTITTTLSTWATGATSVIDLWITNTWTSLSTWINDTWTAFSTWATDAGTAISTWATDATLAISTWITDTATGISTWVTDRIADIGNWVTTTGSNIASWANTAKNNITSWATTAKSNVQSFATSSASNISSFVSTTLSRISSWASTTTSKIQTAVSTGTSKIATFCSNTVSKISTWSSNSLSTTRKWASEFASKVGEGCKNALSKITSFISDSTSKLSSWASSVANTISSLLSKAASAATSAMQSASSAVSRATSGHATGGIYNREHIARISEGNKAEAIIPLQNQTAMQPFVDAVSQGLTESLGPLVASIAGNMGGSDDRTPVYVGTLIADEQGLKELERKMQVIRLKETRRTT